MLAEIVFVLSPTSSDFDVIVMLPLPSLELGSKCNLNIPLPSLAKIEAVLEALKKSDTLIFANVSCLSGTKVWYGGNSPLIS